MSGLKETTFGSFTLTRYSSSNTLTIQFKDKETKIVTKLCMDEEELHDLAKVLKVYQDVEKPNWDFEIDKFTLIKKDLEELNLIYKIVSNTIFVFPKDKEENKEDWWIYSQDTEVHQLELSKFLKEVIFQAKEFKELNWNYDKD